MSAIDYDSFRVEVEACNQLARDWGYGQGEIDTDGIAVVLRRQMDRMEATLKSLETQWRKDIAKVNELKAKESSYVLRFASS